MEKQILQKVKEHLKQKKQTYITLDEIKEIIEQNEDYFQIANIINMSISDGILKPIR